MDKTEERLSRWCMGEGIDFVDAQAEAEYKKRAKRVADSVLMRSPDRVPVTLSFGVFPALTNGCTAEDIFFNGEKSFEAYKKTILTTGADAFKLGMPIGPFLETAGSKQVRLPGRGVPAESNLQFVESECETAEEFYDAFLEDPTGFILRTHWPRIFSAAEPLKQLNPMGGVFSHYSGAAGVLASIAAPGVVEAFTQLAEAGNLAVTAAKFGKEKSMEMAALGFPEGSGGAAYAPFDAIGDFIRGTRGMMLDMFRCPDKIVDVMEKLTPMILETGLNARKSLSPFVLIPLHKGCEGFMSLEQYKELYWPTLRKVIMGLIDEGLVPMLFFEGENSSRLEVISDIPAGKAIYHFESVDLNKAREILGRKICFRGNVPISLLHTGTPDDVAAYVRKLIDIFGKNGGLIVDSGAIFDEAKSENVQAMVAAVKKYGV